MKNDGNENVSKKSIISSISGINNLNEKIKDYHNPIIVKLSIKGLCLEPLI